MYTKQILQNDFSIAMTKKIEREVSEMCNLSKGVEERGISKGITIGRTEGITIGRTEGIAIGKESAIIELVQKNLLSIAEAAEFLSMSESQFKSLL